MFLRYNISIRNKIFFSSIIGLILFASFVIYYYPKHQRHQIYDAVEAKDHFLAETIAIGVAIGIEKSDFIAVGASLDVAQKDVNMLYVGLFDEMLNPLSEINMTDKKIDANDIIKLSEFTTYNKMPVHVSYEPIRVDDKFYGTLIYVSDLSHANEDIEHNKMDIIIYGSFIFILGLIIAFITSCRITRPILNLIEASERIAGGEKNVIINGNNSGEIGELNKSFNSMSCKIEEMIEKLSQSRKRYQDLTETSPTGIFRTDPNGNCSYANERGVEITGFAKEDIIGKNLLDLVLPEYRKKLLANWREAKRQKSTSTTELKLLSELQKNKWVNIKLSGEFDAQGALIGMVGTVEDINMRKRAESINEALIDILEAMSTTSNLENFLDELHDILGQLIDTTNFYVALYHPEIEKYSFPFYKDEYDAVSDLPVNLKKSFTDYVRRTGEPLFLNRALFEEMIKQGKVESIGEPASLWLGVPLKTQNGIIGVAVVQSYNNRELYSEADLDILTLASGHIAMAIERKKSDDELKQNEELLRKTLDSTVDGIVVTDSNEKILIANDHYFKMWNIPGAYLKEDQRHKLRPFIFDQLVDPEASSTRFTKLSLSSEENYDTLYFKDGRIFDHYSCPLIRNAVTYGRVWSFRDITEVKKAEAKLAELAAFPEANTSIVISLSEDFEILYMNTATKTIMADLGMTNEELNDLLPKNIKSIFNDISGGYEGRNNIEVTYKGHSFLWSFVPVFGQKIVHGYATDITESLKQKNEMMKLSTVVNQSSSMVMILDTDLVVEYVNPFFSKVTGHSLADMVGRSIRDFDSEKHPDIFYDALWEKVQKGMTWSGNIQFMKRNGEWFWQRTTITPIFSERKEIINYFINGFDVTVELHTQQKLIESDKLSAVGTLAAGVAHEFKNYLGGIIGNASFCLEELDDDDGVEKARSTLNDIIDMGEKANEVAMSLLTYSKSKMEDRKEEDLKAVINKSIKLVESEFKNLDIEVITHFEDVPEVEISVSKIQQVLLNLLINASHAIKSHGVVSIYLKNQNHRAEIRVADSGAGIKKQNLDKIFDPFFSTKGVWGKDDVVGTGMGLSICRNIIKEHGDDLTVDSIEGIGTTFYLSLPIAEDKLKHKQVNNSIERKGLVFSLDRSVMSSLYEQACQYNSTLTIIDDVYLVKESLKRLANFVICDAKFSAKMELLKMVEMCQEQKVPYVLIKCGSMEYQLEEIYEKSLVNFKEIPDFKKIYEAIFLKASVKA